MHCTVTIAQWRSEGAQVCIFRGISGARDAADRRMKRAPSIGLAASLAMILLACSGTSAIGLGAAGDSGSTATTGAGDDDSGVVLPQEPISNGKSDTPVEDGGAPSSNVDAGAIVDGSTILDGATLDGSSTVNGCSESGFVNDDQSDPLAARTIDVSGGGHGPRRICMRIKLGETVTFQGSFGIAPLEPSGGATPSPIVETKNGKTVTFAFPSAGTFGFKTVAGKDSIAGAIDVTP